MVLALLSQRIEIIGEVAALIALIGILWLAWHILQQQGRLLLRIEAAEAQSDEAGSAATSSEVNGHGITRVLLQQEREVAAYQATGMHGAVLIGADDSIGSPAARGADAMRSLVTSAIALPALGSVPLEADQSQRNGHGTMAVLRPPTGLKLGEAAPDFSLPDLSGKLVHLSDFLGHRTLLLFWQPGCGFCQRMLADLKAWEAQPSEGAPRLIVISSESVTDNQAIGLRSPIVLDQAGMSIGSTFGASGTPMAILVDAEGKIASELAAGAPAVLALARRGPEEAEQLNPHAQEETTLMNDAAPVELDPLPLARKIVEHMQPIPPGWLQKDEAELLVDLVRRAVASAQSNPPVLVEMGSYCGRATVTMGLAARELGREDVRIIAIDEPALGPAPDGGTPRNVLRSLRSVYELERMVTLAPEEECAPWQQSCQLLLIDGKHDYENVRGDVERYAPSLAPGGLLVFHDYGDDLFPDVRRYVNEVLVSPGFAFVAQVGTLIALKRLSEGHPLPTTGMPVLKKGTLPVEPLTTWLYWQGNLPAYIALCCKSIFAHAQNVVLLDRVGFDTLFKHDRDIHIDALPLPKQSDFIRAYLLKHYGGLYIDVDCIVMRDLSPVQAMVKQYEFVGYHDQPGRVSANFMASEPEGAVINAHYEAICTTLRSHRPRGWLDLASTPLTKVTAQYPDKNFLLPPEAITPMGWHENGQLYRRGSDEEHERHFQHDAFCYMLANQTIKTLPETQVLSSMSEEQILNENYFLSFLFRMSCL